MPQRLKALRKKSGLSQADFAKKLFLSRGLYNGLETGREIPSEWVVQQVDTLERLGIEILERDYKHPAGGSKHIGEDAVDSAVAGIGAEFHRQLAETIIAADGDPDRLSWIKVQLKTHLTPPRDWLDHEELDAKAIEFAKRLGSARGPSRRDAGSSGAA